MSAWAMVVPFESRAQIIGDPDIVLRWINVAADDVNDALLDAVHAEGRSTDRAMRIWREIASVLGGVRGFLNLDRAVSLRILRCGPPSPEGLLVWLAEKSLPSRSSPKASEGWLGGRDSCRARRAMCEPREA